MRQKEVPGNWQSTPLSEIPTEELIAIAHALILELRHREPLKNSSQQKL